MITEPATCACGNLFFPTPSRRDQCRVCAMSKNNQRRTVYECERCGRVTLMPLMEINDEQACSACHERGPDPTPEEIRAMAAQLRAERTPNFVMD